MSIHTNIFSTLVLASILFSSVVTTSAQNSGILSAPLSNSSFTYCNWNNFMSTSDVEAARQVIGTSAYFYVTENTSANVINGKCVNNLVANFVPYIAGHTTNFDISNGGAVSNVKLKNESPYLASLKCDGDDTVALFKDVNQNYLTYNTIVGDNNNFEVSSSQESNNNLKVTLKRKNYNYTGTNTVTVYVNENLPINPLAGYVNVSNTTSSSSSIMSSSSSSMMSSSSAKAYNLVNVTIDKTATTIKETFKVSGVCNAVNYTSSSSSSMMSSSSSSSSSSMTRTIVTTTSTSTTPKAIITSDTTTVVYGGKGVLTRTGGSN